MADDYYDDPFSQKPRIREARGHVMGQKAYTKAMRKKRRIHIAAPLFFLTFFTVTALFMRFLWRAGIDARDGIDAVTAIVAAIAITALVATFIVSWSFWIGIAAAASGIAALTLLVPIPYPPLTVACGTFLVAFLLFAVCRRYLFHLLNLAAFVAVVFFAARTAYVADPEIWLNPHSAQPQEQTDAKIVYVVLKNGVNPLAALTRPDRETNPAWQTPIGFYEWHGFALYPAAGYADAEPSVNLNEPLDALAKSGYRINVYQTDGDGLCSRDDSSVADRCLTWSARGGLLRSGLPIGDKILRLASWWAADLEIIRPEKHAPAFGQAALFERLWTDVGQDKGKNAYVILSGLGGRYPAYDSRCAFANGQGATRDGETLCAYRLMNGLMNSIDPDRDTVVVLAGRDMLTVRRPGSGERHLDIDETHCDVNTLLSRTGGIESKCRKFTLSKELQAINERIKSFPDDWTAAANSFARFVGELPRDESKQPAVDDAGSD